MTDATPKTEPTTTGKAPRRDRLVRWGFVGLILVVVIVVFAMQQGRTLTIPGWGDDLAEALKQARQSGRRVVVLYVRTPPSDTAKSIRRHAEQPANVEALQAGRFLPVVVTTAPEATGARDYEITAFPTLLILAPDGTELLRHEGLIGEVPFRQAFLEKAPPGPGKNGSETTTASPSPGR